MVKVPQSCVDCKNSSHYDIFNSSLNWSGRLGSIFWLNICVWLISFLGPTLEQNIPDNKKSIALNVTIQSSEKTLNEDDLNKINQTIITAVESKLDAKIRS